MTHSPAPAIVEQWRAVPGWPHQASNHGRIRSVDRIDGRGLLRLGTPVAPYLDKRPGKGYLYVTLIDGQRRRNVAVHVLVLEAWRGLKPGPGYEGCHDNGIRTDNYPGNLYWKTKPENRADRERHRLEKAVTDTGVVTVERSQKAGFPSVLHHSGSVTGDESPGTGRSPFLFDFPSHSMFVNPLVRTFRTSLQSLRDRRAA